MGVPCQRTSWRRVAATSGAGVQHFLSNVSDIKAAQRCANNRTAGSASSEDHLLHRQKTRRREVSSMSQKLCAQVRSSLVTAGAAGAQPRNKTGARTVNTAPVLRSSVIVSKTQNMPGPACWMCRQQQFSAVNSVHLGFNVLVRQDIWKRSLGVQEHKPKCSLLITLSYKYIK